MKTSLWLIILVVIFFLGFLVGYSFSPTAPAPPMETGARH
jgi:hypothetical protein